MLDSHSKSRLIRAIRDVERRNRTQSGPQKKRRNPNPLMMTVKPEEDMPPGSTKSCEIWSEDGATGVYEDCHWEWTADGKIIDAGTECIAARLSQWENWTIVGAACSGLSEAPGAPVDPPTAAGELWVLDGDAYVRSDSIAAAGQSLDKLVVVISIPPTDFLVMQGDVGSVPDVVYDSRGTLTIADVGTNILGFIEAVTVDTTAGSLTPPLNGNLTATQTDEQFASVSLASTGLLYFDGASGWVDCGSDASLDDLASSGVTIVTRTFVLSDGENDLGKFVDKNNATWFFGTAGESGGNVQLQFVHGWSTTAQDSITTSAVLPIGSWAQAAVTYDGSATANRPSFYIDGVSQAVTNTTNAAGTITADASGNLYIGNTAFAADDRTLHAGIDWLRIYQTEFPATWLHPDVIDAQDRAVCDFDGTDDYIDVGDHATYDFGSGDFALEARVRLNDVSSNYMMISKDGSSSQRQFAMLLLGASSDKVRVLYAKVGNSTVYLDSVSTLTSNKWYHIVCQRVGNSFEIWIDGVLDASGTTSGTHAAMNTSTASVEIGRRAYPGSENYMNGQIRDARIYGSSLSSAEVEYNHTLGVSGTAPPTPVGEWLLNDRTGTTAADTGSGGHDGTLTGGVAWFELLVEGWEANEGTGTNVAASVSTPTNDGTLGGSAGWS